MANILVCGAGISGLAAAHRLLQLGHNVQIAEKSGRAGGSIETVTDGGYLFEKGPNSFLDNAPGTLELCRELRLENRLLRQSLRENKRFIYLNGKLHNVPAGPGPFFQTELLTRPAKWNLFLEAFKKSNRSPADESVGSFVRRRLGDEVALHLLTPFISGVYAGDPDQLSLRAAFPLLYDLERGHGSLTRGMLARALSREKPETQKPRARNLCSFVDGMSELTDALAKALEGRIALNADIRRIEKKAGYFTADAGASQPTGAHWDAVISALPAHAAAPALGHLLPESAPYLETIPYNRLCVVGVGYKRDQLPFAPEGFGFLAPRKQGIRILGAIWNSSLFANRAPGGECGFNVFVGGALDPDAFGLSDGELLNQVKEDLGKAMGARGEPAKFMVTRWERAIPQYPVGHVERMETLRRELDAVQGLFMTGNHIDGVSVNDCVRNGRAVAERAHRFCSEK